MQNKESLEMDYQQYKKIDDSCERFLLFADSSHFPRRRVFRFALRRRSLFVLAEPPRLRAESAAAADPSALHVASADRIVGFPAKANASGAREGRCDESGAEEGHRDDGAVALRQRGREAVEAGDSELGEIAGVLRRKRGEIAGGDFERRANRRHRIQ